MSNCYTSLHSENLRLSSHLAHLTQALNRGLNSIPDHVVVLKNENNYLKRLCDERLSEIEEWKRLLARLETDAKAQNPESHEIHEFQEKSKYEVARVAEGKIRALNDELEALRERLRMLRDENEDYLTKIREMKQGEAILSKELNIELSNSFRTLLDEKLAEIDRQNKARELELQNELDHYLRKLEAKNQDDQHTANQFKTAVEDMEQQQAYLKEQETRELERLIRERLQILEKQFKDELNQLNQERILIEEQKREFEREREIFIQEAKEKLYGGLKQAKSIQELNIEEVNTLHRYEVEGLESKRRQIEDDIQIVNEELNKKHHDDLLNETEINKELIIELDRIKEQLKETRNRNEIDIKDYRGIIILYN